MPRKTCRNRRRPARGNRASMRPRPDAAENHQEPVLGVPVERASMRPRPDAAENHAKSPLLMAVESLLQ